MIRIKEYVQQEKMKLRDRSVTPGITPKLGIIDGTNKDDSANQLYIKNKIKDFNELGWEAKVYRVCDGWQLPDDVEYIDRDFNHWGDSAHMFNPCDGYDCQCTMFCPRFGQPDCYQSPSQFEREHADMWEAILKDDEDD